jgi:hypothetical protein
MSHVRRAVAGGVALTAALFTLALPAQSATPDNTSAAHAAVGWITSRLLPDGSFDAGGFFDTRDAALAVAEGAQTGGAWSTAQAVSALAALKYNGTGPTPLNALDAVAAAATSPGAAAKTIVLSAAPLGLDPAAFDAAGDGSPVDLVTRMGGCSTSSDPAFNNLLYILLAQRLVCGAPSAAGLESVRDQQQPDGSWNGDEFASLDVDTTALAVDALVAGGADASDPAVHAALGFFATNQQADGAWQFFGTDDPNSTGLGILGVTATGYDVETPCWRDQVDPSTVGTPYTSPTAWLRTQQLSSPPDQAGRIQSPNDQFPPITTFATAQAVEGLLQSWLPIVRAPAQTCSASTTSTVDTVTPLAGGPITVSGGGFMPSTELTIELHSTPVVLGTTTTDGFGNYTTTVTIPADTEPGVHQLVVTGLGPDGQPRSVSTEITVLAEGATAPVPLSTTPRFTG